MGSGESSVITSVGLAGGFVDVSSGFCNPVMLQISPVTTHRVAMNGANVIVGSNHRAGETFQNDAESSRCDIKATRLEPDTIRVRQPKAVIFQIDARNEVFTAPSTRLEAVGETAKGSDRHMCSFSLLASVVIPSGSDYFLSGAAGTDAGRSEFQISATHFHIPLACFFQTSRYFPRSLTVLPVGSLRVTS